MAQTLFCSILLVVFAVNVCHGWFFFRNFSCVNDDLLSDDNGWCQRCTSRWKKGKDVTLVIRNVLRKPYFEEVARLDCTRSKYLYFMMEEAANINPKFKFTVKYFGPPLGFSVRGINGLFGNFTLDKTFWEILDGNNEQTKLGASSYIPKDGETVTFNFTQSAGH